MEDCPRKKINKNEDGPSNNEESEKSNDRCSHQYLTYDVLRIIFEYLNAKELSNASMVCRSWLEAANNEKRTRGPLYLTRNCILPIRAHEVECTKFEMIEKLRIEPALGLFFTPPISSISNTDDNLNDFPSNCLSITLSTYGIVLDDKEIEENSNHILGVFLPDLPNVTVTTVTIVDDILFKINGKIKSEKKYVDEIRNILDTSEKGPNTSKCLLLFCDLQGRSSAIKIAKSLERCYKADELSVWGGVANSGFLCNSTGNRNHPCKQYALCAAIALVGAIDTWSIIIDKSYKTKEQVEQRLKSFRSRICLKKHSIGLMFACCARGENMFQESNVESSIFKKLFPNVPLAGCFGDGEFGTNRIPNETSSKRKAAWYNEVSTVFLIITYD